jgi:hypothetical protein
MNSHPAYIAQSGCDVIVGSFRPNGSSAVSSTYYLGDGWSVARTSQGLFTLTLSNPLISVVSVVASLQLSTAAARFLQVGDISNSNKTVLIRVVDGSGNVQDVSSDANNRIDFVIVTKTRTV